MPVGGEDFRDQEAVGVILVLHRDVVDVAGVHALAALGEGDAVGPDPAGRVSAPAGGRADRDGAVRFRPRLPVRPVRQVETMGRGLLEDIQPLAQNAPVLPRPGDFSLSFHHDEDHLAASGGPRRALTRAKPVEREAYIAPTRTFGRDVVHLAVGAGGLSMQVSHPWVPRNWP